MQQITSLPLLTPQTNGLESGNNVASASLPVAAAKPAASGSQSDAGDFKQVFLAVTENDPSGSTELLAVQDWQQLLTEQPMPLGELGQTLDNLILLTDLPIKGQNLSFFSSTIGETLPPAALGEQPLGALMSQQMTLSAWSANEGLATAQDDQLLTDSQTAESLLNPINPPMVQIADLATLGSASPKGLAGMAGMAQSIGADDASSQSEQQSTLANFRSPSAVAWDALMGAPGNPLSRMSGLAADSQVGPVADQNFNAFAQSALGRSMLGSGPLRRPEPSGVGMTGATISGANADDLGWVSQGLLPIPQHGVGVIDSQSQGLNLGGLTHSDALFKAHYEMLNGDSTTSAALAELAGSDRGEAFAELRSEVQAKSVGAGLREYATGIGAHVNDPGWGDQLGQKIVWLSGRNIQSAQVHLNPAELGPIEVKISIQNDQTTVAITAHHASTRELLDANVQRLREVLSANGVDVSAVSVGADERGNGSAAQREGANGDGPNQSDHGLDGNFTGNSDGAPSDDAITVTTSALNLVDFYA